MLCPATVGPRPPRYETWLRQGVVLQAASLPTPASRHVAHQLAEMCRRSVVGSQRLSSACLAPRCRIEPYLDQAAPLRGAAGPASAPRSALGGPRGARRAASREAPLDQHSSSATQTGCVLLAALSPAGSGSQQPDARAVHQARGGITGRAGRRPGRLPPIQAGPTGAVPLPGY